MSDHPPPAPAEAAVMPHGAEEVRAHLKIYLAVFFALGVLTAITVGIAYLDLPSKNLAIAAAMVIALVKGSLVALYFMHLIKEARVIYWSLALCVVFFAALMALPVLTSMEHL
ncbi:MAG: cytochrome C oxidase subunit IV family protein [Planctomycetes bacterium]|nr:cytochrome C oxidase subunit IV family protein [Planctomycetota bacterium]